MNDYLGNNSLCVLNGMHIYLGIKNFDDLMDLDPKKYPHESMLLLEAFDLLLKQLEQCLNSYQNSYIEKLSGSRIHCVIEEDPNNQYDFATIFYEISKCFFWCIDAINNRINRYSKIDDLVVSIGCDYGKFANYTIKFVDPCEDNSIGSPCNKAAKIQTYADPQEILVSSDAFSKLLEGKRKMPFSLVGKERTVLKGTRYEGTYYSLSHPQWDSIDKDNQLIESKNLKEDFASLIDKLRQKSQHNVSARFTAYSNASILYCDIRGFTKMFNEDGSNLSHMCKLTIDSLQRMNSVGLNKKMRHIQFQGDREMFLSTDTTCTDSIIAAIYLIDEFKKHANILNEEYKNSYKDLAVGIGVSSGNFYLGSVGIKGSSSPLVVGKPSVYADEAEDKYASKPYSIAIHQETYNNALKSNNKAFVLTLKKIFSRIPNTQYFVTNFDVSYNNFLDIYQKSKFELNSMEQSSDRGKPWSH